MELTGLEVTLASALGAVVVWNLSSLAQGLRFQTKAECNRRHCDLDKGIDEIKRGQRTQFRMLRAIIPHLPIEEEKKVAILNETGGE